ncbi:unnamed protein product [Brassicogethes aeneus]|uniref:RING-type domain-containing protein n=1 Tax=Brassicogethes aeneus TaxID=1431903 RepID=A0A9P0AT92_BRAAE|nr:unnamed protein product [Brassicogethes aeneus]
MFRKNKNENKAKLEHKLYLARENPEPIFDLSDCNVDSVPQGIYSLCKVFLKNALYLQHNNLTSLSGGGHLKDLALLEILDISNNQFSTIPDEIYLLKNLQEFNISCNKVKKLPESICSLSNLKSLDLSGNNLKNLPEEIGNLCNLRTLNINSNKNLKALPKSTCKAQHLSTIKLDAFNFVYPPQEVASAGASAIMEYICEDTGYNYVLPDEADDLSKEKIDTNEEEDKFQAKIWELEKIKQQKMREFLEIERNNELMHRQEIELANTQKVNKEKLLAEIARDQNKFDLKLTKLNKLKEFERFRLIEQIQEVENNADLAIKQLLSLNREPQIQLLEQEKLEEERLLEAVTKYNENLQKEDILMAMEEILNQETVHFVQFHQNRIETSRSILESEMENDSRLLVVLKSNDLHKAELLSKLQEERDLQKAAVGTLLERGDARSWGLLQQVRLVEAQLAALTTIEMDRRQLEMIQNLNDLSEKRINLSILLLDLLYQQKERRSQLVQTLSVLEEFSNDDEDFWLQQYQRLLDKLPTGLSQAQKNIDPLIGQALVMNGVLHCLPFLAKLTQCQLDTNDITDEDLRNAGVIHSNDRLNILNAFQIYKKEKECFSSCVTPSAPVLPVEEASAPLLEEIHCSANTTDCVICLDLECQIIFVPCGHLCCCSQCSTMITECPMCRSSIERKIKVIAS